MKDKSRRIASLLIIFCSIGFSMGCSILNFQEFIKGSPANAKNGAVTFLYVISWLICIRAGVKMKSRVILRYCLLFWILTLLAAGFVLYGNITDITLSFGLLFVVSLIGQFYGIYHFITSYLVGSILLTMISLIMSGLAMGAIRRIK